jgi:hypothetical protein
MVVRLNIGCFPFATIAVDLPITIGSSNLPVDKAKLNKANLSILG